MMKTKEKWRENNQNKHESAVCFGAKFQNISLKNKKLTQNHTKMVYLVVWTHLKSLSGFADSFFNEFIRDFSGWVFIKYWIH